MRLIDADALVAKMNLAIGLLKMAMKNFDIEDDPECQMELKAYKDIRDGIKEEPTIEPERKKRKWIYGEKSGQDGWYCSECGGFIPWYYDFYGLDNIDFIEDFKTCPFCDSKMVSYTGADMREGE